MKIISEATLNLNEKYSLKETENDDHTKLEEIHDDDKGEIRWNMRRNIRRRWRRRKWRRKRW